MKTLVTVPEIPTLTHTQVAVMAVFCRPHTEIESIKELHRDLSSNCGYTGSLQQLWRVVKTLMDKGLLRESPKRAGSKVLVESRWEPTTDGYTVHADFRAFYKTIYEHAIA